MTKPINPKLAKFIAQSKVKERVYHGTGNLEGLTSFDPAMTGKGTDQLGSGFYLSNDPEEASGYAGSFNQSTGKPNSSPGVIPAHVAIRKPIKIGPNGNSLNDARINLSHDQVKQIMGHAPNILDSNDSPLGNHVDTSRGVTPRMIHDIARMYTGNHLHALENDIFPNDPTAYRHALHKVTGHDGVIKDFGNGRKHYVAWFPEQIKSAIGNRGTYDPNDPDITKAKGGSVEPKKTVKAYKLFRVHPKHPGKLFPLFVHANQPVDLDTWHEAQIGEMTGDKVKSKIGPLAFRPGWHAGDLPVATHIGEKSDPKLTAPDTRPANHVWAEVEMPDDVDWQSVANERGTNAQGRVVPVKAHITDQIPKGGHYRYKTNSNMTGNWLIGGAMKVNKVLSDKEVRAINKAAGVADLPRATPFPAKKYGFASGGLVAPDEWKADEHVNYGKGVAHMAEGGQYPYAQAHEQARINAIKMLGLHEHNTAQDRAEAMGINTDVFHGSKQDIRGGYQPGYDDNLAFVTPDSEFANKWIGKGKHNERIGDEAKAERKAAENMYKDIKFKHMDYDELNKLEGDKFHNEYDRRNAIVKAKAKKEFGLRGTPDAIHSTVYPMKVRANKTFNPETDMHDMSDFFVKHGIPQKNIDLYKTGNYMMYETKPVVNHLKSKGYDSMRLRESTDDNYPTIAVFDPKHVRSRFAAFDPARQHENDLLAKRGGRVTHAHHLEIEERPL